MIIGNNIGIFHSDSDYSIITENTFENNTNHGISIASSDYCSVSGNTVKRSDAHGIYIGDSANNTVAENTVESIGIGHGTRYEIPETLKEKLPPSELLSNVV